MLTCPAPLDHGDIVELAHGGGGRKTARLIETLFAPAFRNPHLEPLGDGAIVTVGSERLAFTTDTFVVKPVFFPGGDIGSLAVHGTVNDLAMCGAEPLFLSAGYLLEEGFPMRDLERVVASMAAACAAVGVLARHRGHQGRGPGQGRRHLHQHLRRGPRARRRRAWARAAPRPGTPCSSRARSATTGSR